MMRSVSFISIACLLLQLQSCTKAGLPSLRESYRITDTKPFGGYAAYNLVSSSYNSRYVYRVETAFADYFSEGSDTSAVYFNVSKNFFCSAADAEALLTFIEAGNTAFISAANISSDLLNKLYAEQAYRDFAVYNNSLLRNTDVRLSASLDSDSTGFGYYYLPLGGSFPKIHNQQARIIGYNDENSINCFVFFYGKGRIYLHAEPRAFSNYFLLTKTNEEYLRQILSLLPADPSVIYWDEYYVKRNSIASSDTDDESFSTLSGIMKYPATANAFWLCLALLLIYILFARKRRQRSIKVLKPVLNSSVAFAEAMAGLYLQDRNNRYIADKIITYFHDRLRTKYFVNGHFGDENFADLVSRKTNVPAETIKRLEGMVLLIQAKADVSDRELLELNEQIEKFQTERS